MALEKLTYNVEEVAELLGLSTVTIGKAAREGKLPPTIEAGGKRLVWVKTIINDWIAAGCPSNYEQNSRAKFKRKSK